MTESVAEAWARCRPYIEAAVKTCGTHDISDIEQLIAAGKAQFWPGAKCAAVTEVCSFPTGVALHHWLSGGDLKELLRQGRQIEEWARRQGFKRVFGSSEDRPGFRRVMDHLGYSAGQIEYFKDLT